MNKFYDLQVDLVLKAPILSSTGGNALRGVDRVFSRDSNGNVVMQRSHIKGKLRESLIELSDNGGVNFSKEEWFGKPFEENFESGRAKLIFSDFKLEQPIGPNNKISTRVAIDPKTGTSKERFLQINELLFASGQLSRWKGHIYFWADTAQSAKEMESKLDKGLKWITAFGSMKGIGYGRLEKVNTRLEECKNFSKTFEISNGKYYSIYIELNDDIFIGGNVNSSNYHESERVIPGAVIKGSIARCLNEICGEAISKPIDESNSKVDSKFPALTKNFSNIRFSHAFPCPFLQKKRAVVVPFSAVEDSKNQYKDIALLPDINSKLDSYGKAPKLQIDWKNPEGLNEAFGWQEYIAVNKTRTKIKGRTRTAEEDKLYTFQYISPYTKVKTPKAEQINKINWIASIQLPENDTEEIARELLDLMNSGWHFIGKRDARFSFTVKPGFAIPAIAQKNIFEKNEAVITLQSDALIFDAYDLKNLENLHNIYQEYWDEATDGACNMLRFFARQKMVGRYYGMRFKRLHKNNYYPFVLTSAGSVFVLEAKDIDRATTVLAELQNKGLPLPKAIKNKMSDLAINENNTWQVCPFVKENGYGEIIINLEWHWKNKLS